MWKDFFYYSKSERRSIIFLASMGIFLLVYGTWIHFTKHADLPEVDSLQVDSFCIRAYKERLYRDSFPKKYTGKSTRKAVPVLEDFDPNTIDSAGLCRLGLPSFLAKRIINYRNKGGVFRKAEDLSRIYGLSPHQFQVLKPYIVIQSELTEPKRSMGTSALALNSADTIHYVVHKGEGSTQKFQELTVLDLNSVDTTQLKHVPGIGSGLAKMIIAYRNRLGGYAHVSQLQEIGYVDSTLNKWFKIESPIMRSIRVNHSGLDQLRNHPYMNFYKAKAILEYRRKRGQIKGLSQLSMFQEFTEKDLQRLTPYLDFN